MKRFRQSMALVVSACLIFITAGEGAAFQTEANDSPPGLQPVPQAAQQSPEQLRQLVAPIALYPDTLIAQILPAATYPEEIVDAGRWMDQHKSLTGDDLAAQVDQQPWDASVKALTQFPAVLANMNQNLAWTSELGDTYLNQQQELSQAIQTMRERARQAGHLETNTQQTVSDSGQTIVIQPAQPDVVYVPQYDPWLVYGDPLAEFPGWYPYPGLFLDGTGIYFGTGFGVGLFGGFGWGWNRWGFDWHNGGRVVFNRGPYISHSRTIVDRHGFQSGQMNFDRGGDVRGRDFGTTGGFRGPESPRVSGGMGSGAFSGFNHGGVARGNAFRGQSSFGGGFHGGGGGGRR